MHHAEHFLGRLTRLATSEVDLALQLYRDPELLRAILVSARPPESAERVALSLEDPEQGPFIVVTREGRFVTCLGRGMRVSDLFVITRSRLDTVADKIAVLRERMELARRLTGSSERPSAHLLRRLVVAADQISREEWLAVSVWEPMLQPVLLATYLDMSRELLEQGPLLRRQRPRGPRGDEILHTYWNLVHAAGHMLLLATMGGDREHFQTLTADSLAARSALSFAMTSTAMTSFITRGAWAVGRMGKQLLPAYKAALAADVCLFDWVDTLLGLCAMGRRSTSMRAEITKALRATHRVATTPDAQHLRAVMSHEMEMMAGFAVSVMDLDDEELEQDLLRQGGALLGDVPAEAPEEELPPELLRALPFHLHLDGVSDGKKLCSSLMYIAASARGAPEQFYLPAVYAQALHRPWEPSFTERLLAPMAMLERSQRRPVRRVAAPGPNQPCACGSGRKAKRCCGNQVRSP